MNIHCIYHVYIYMVYTWYVQWCIHIEGIYYVYIMHIHGMYMLYTVMSTYTRNILCIYHVYTWYLHRYTMYIMCICSTWRLMLRRRTGSRSTCSTSNDIFLHSCEYLGFLAKWTCRARLELKIARALSSRVSCTTRASALTPAQSLCWSQTWNKFL